MRAGMLNEHVIVHMLAAIGHEQAIDQAFTSLACEDRMNVVANQRSAQKQRMRGHVGVASLLDAQGGKVVSLVAFAPDHVLRNIGVVAGDYLYAYVAQSIALPQLTILSPPLHM